MRALLRGQVLVLVLATSGCSFKYAPASFSDDRLGSNSEALAIEGGLVFLDGETQYGRVDLGLNAAYQTFDFVTDAGLSFVEVTGRLMPWPDGNVQPYLGLGLGMHRLAATETTNRCGRQTICVTSTADQHQIETGLNPHWTAGVEFFPGGRTAGLIAGVTHEFAASAVDWNLSSFRFSAGFVYRPN